MNTSYKILSRALIGLGGFALISCGDNPTENMQKAQVSDAVEKEAQETPAGAVKYVFTPDSSISFVGSKKIGASHTGGFKEFSGHFHLLNGEPVGNEHRVLIQMDSTYSDNEKLTAHLKNEDFFAVESHPTASFDVTSLTLKEPGKYEVAGNLTLRGTTKNITFVADVAESDGTATLKADFEINRMDFGVAYQGAGDNFINEEVGISFDLKAVPES